MTGEHLQLREQWWSTAELASSYTPYGEDGKIEASMRSSHNMHHCLPAPKPLLYPAGHIQELLWDWQRWAMGSFWIKTVDVIVGWSTRGKRVGQHHRAQSLGLSVCTSRKTQGCDGRGESGGIGIKQGMGNFTQRFVNTKCDLFHSDRGRERKLFLPSITEVVGHQPATGRWLLILVSYCCLHNLYHSGTEDILSTSPHL